MTISVTLVLVAITALVSWQGLSHDELQEKFLHAPFVEHRQREFYRWITSMFLHGSILHLAVNMFVLWGFGTVIEDVFVELFGPWMGRFNYLGLYILSGIAADIPTYIKHKHNPAFRSVGASGATSGVLFAYVVFAPWEIIRLYGIVPIPTIIAAIAYLAYSSYASRKESHSRIDHEAHFWGAVFGFVFTIALKPELFSFFLEQVVEGFPL